MLNDITIIFLSQPALGHWLKGCIGKHISLEMASFSFFVVLKRVLSYTEYTIFWVVTRNFIWYAPNIVAKVCEIRGKAIGKSDYQTPSTRCYVRC